MEPPKGFRKALRGIAESEDDSSVRTKARSMLRELDVGDRVCLLRKALYDTSQAGGRWYTKLLRRRRFERNWRDSDGVRPMFVPNGFGRKRDVDSNLRGRYEEDHREHEVVVQSFRDQELGSGETSFGGRVRGNQRQGNLTSAWLR